MHAACRGFTTLSTTLGRMLLSLHDGLLQALASEQHAAAAGALLQALQALLRGAPYHRLPEDLLPRTLEVQHGHVVLPGGAAGRAAVKGKQALLQGAFSYCLLGQVTAGPLAYNISPPDRKVVESCRPTDMGCRQHREHIGLDKGGAACC